MNGPGSKRARRALSLALALAAAVGAVASSGCDRSPANEPLVESFGFPISMVARRYDVNGEDVDVLFVVNANFDLQLRGGSVVVVDVGAAEAAAAGCADVTTDAGDCLRTTPDGTPRLRPESFMHPSDAVRIASYAREIVIDAGGSNLYVTSGGDDSITWVEVDPSKLRTARADGFGVLSCYEASSENAALLAANAGLVDGNGDVTDADGDGVEDDQMELPDCGDPWTPRPELFNSELDDEERMAAADSGGVSPEEWRRFDAMASSPFGIDLDPTGRLLHATGFDSAALTVMRLREAGDPCFGLSSCVGQPVFLNSFPSVTLATGVAVHPTTGLAYVTGRSPADTTSGIQVDVFETAAMATEPEPFLPIFAEDLNLGEDDEVPDEVSPLVDSLRFFREAGHDLRGIDFSGDGERAYVVERSGGADSLLIIDIAGASTGDVDAPFETAIDVGRGAQHLAVIPGAGASGGDVVVVSCFADGALYVVDTDLLEVVAIIRTDSGPFGMTLWPDEAAPERLFVASFRASTVTAIDVTSEPTAWARLYTLGAQRVDEN